MEPEREKRPKRGCVREREKGGGRRGGAREGGWGRGAREEEEGRREEEQGGAGGGEKYTETEELRPSGGGERVEGTLGGERPIGENMGKPWGWTSATWVGGMLGAWGQGACHQVSESGTLVVDSGR